MTENQDNNRKFGVRNEIKFRTHIVLTTFTLLVIAILLKLLMIQVNDGDKLRSLSANMTTRGDVIGKERGSIYSEDGLPLVTNQVLYDIHEDFSVIDDNIFDKNIDSLAKCMSMLLENKSPEWYKEAYTTAKSKNLKYYPIAKSVSQVQYNKMKYFPIFSRGKNRGGFIADARMIRSSPELIQKMAYRTIGIWREKAQNVGLEASYDSVLRGQEGSVVRRKAAFGVWLNVQDLEVAPVKGYDIITTLNMRIQRYAHEALIRSLDTNNCQYGTCVVIEVSTGKIRALVNLGRQSDGTFFEDFNYALMLTEPGSVFKLATLIALFSDGYVNSNTVIDAEGGIIRFGNLTMRDSHLGLGRITVKDAFAYSSNVAFAKLAYQYYKNNPKQYLSYLEELHLDGKTGIDISGEPRSIVKSPNSRTWSNTTLPWMATGYEVLISPMQICMLYNAIANDGKMMRPYLVNAISDFGEKVYTNKPKEIMNIGNKNVIRQIQECLHEVMKSGTGKVMNTPSLDVCGKTGTAQVADKGIKYSDSIYQTTFVGYLPSVKPKYTICVVIRTRNSAKNYYASGLALPVFRVIASKIHSRKIGY